MILTNMNNKIEKFQFTPLREGRLARQNVGDCIRVFQFTPLREGRPVQLGGQLPRRHFNSRPSARGDFLLAVLAVCFRVFQFTPLREGRPMVNAQYLLDVIFQFTPLREGRRESPFWLQPEGCHFNSRPSARGDGHHLRGFANMIFQFTPLREGRRSHHSRTSPRGYFNSRPSARGDHLEPPEVADPQHFNSRPSARGDGLDTRRQCARPISIHAPPRGATYQVAGIKISLRFQFTPLREGRRNRPACAAADCNFNSRPSARGDLADLQTKYNTDKFQFTPLREGRPTATPTSPPPARNFNSRPSARGDRPDTRLQCYLVNFNSRPSARGDLRVLPRRTSTPNFNSRPSARGDPKGGGRMNELQFQFTPLREGRQRGRLSFSEGWTFQFTPLREGRRLAGRRTGACAYFNSRPSARGDECRCCKSRGNSYFNSRPSARGDSGQWSHRKQLPYFNSRPSARGDCKIDDVHFLFPISIHAPPRGATRRSSWGQSRKSISIHAPPRGATFWRWSPPPSALVFQFTPLREGRR